MSARTPNLVGREKEIGQIGSCIKAGRNVLLEGPVGVGKTKLAVYVTEQLKRRTFRIDGDSRYSEQKLAGWFDPPSVIKNGFGDKSFIPGPLVEAMRAGGILFINELNRLPEGVQNVLLPAIDERIISVPRLGEIKAKPGFAVIATQNPKEFVATSHLSEAILDRFELVRVEYQNEDEETAIVNGGLEGAPKALALAAVRLARITRSHPRVKRGASVRAAQAVAQITVVMIAEGKSLRDAFLAATLLAFPTRIEIERDVEGGVDSESMETLLQEWADAALEGDSAPLKKKY